jgi:7-carboxy-7-deazaguanine synthase
LLQPNALPLMKQLCDDGFTVLVETSGALDISQVDPRVRRIMDLKCPSSGEVERNRLENIPHLKATDEIKFVIGTVEDYEWAKQQIAAHKLDAICPAADVVGASAASRATGQIAQAACPPGQTPITRKELVERIIRRRAAGALPGAIAQNHLAAGAARSLRNLR